MTERLPPETLEQVARAYGQYEGGVIVRSLLDGVEGAEAVLGVTEPKLDVSVEVVDKEEWAGGIRATGDEDGIRVTLGAQAPAQYLTRAAYRVGAHEAGHAFRHMIPGAYQDYNDLNAFHRTVDEGYAECVKHAVVLGDNYAPEGLLNLTAAERKSYDDALVELLCGDRILPETQAAYLDFHRGNTKYGDPYKVGHYLFATYGVHNDLGVRELAAVGYQELEDFAGTML
ncbi:MAG: hypothetical protein JWN38_146 [Candidatus Saccharibacteria bacterium]|nr:hypothetical protein [Candidatus Saccharibacteria bacterium]